MGALTASPAPRAVRLPRLGAAVAYYASIPGIWAYQFLHNAHGIVRVLDITRFRPMPAGLLSADHPWVTGLNPTTGRPVWHDNLVFRTPRDRRTAADAPPDELIVQRVGRFLAAQVARSVVVPEVPWGLRRRMPHAINYIHGTAHYNSGWLLFNDFTEGFAHFSDPRFAAEVRRFVRTERREVLLVFRQRRCTAREYAYFTAFLRTIFPWFCNSNGPRKRVLWGNQSPFPVVNIIAGNWVRDIYRLKNAANCPSLARPAISSGRYFQGGPYRGDRLHARWPEKLLAHWTTWRVPLRLQGRPVFRGPPRTSCHPFEASAGAGHPGRTGGVALSAPHQGVFAFPQSGTTLMMI